MPATRIDPVEARRRARASVRSAAPIGIDAMRYYLLREVPLGNDGDFTFESLFGRFNAELANDLGNLVNRSLTLIGEVRRRASAGARRRAIAEPPSTRTAARGPRAEAIATRDRAQFEAMRADRARSRRSGSSSREANRYVDHDAAVGAARRIREGIELAHVLHEPAGER